MEILSPSPPPSPATDNFLYRGGPLHAGIRRGHADARVHVAVGRSPEKTLALLRWAFRRFACAHVTLVHVHQPSPVIPTLLGKIPAAQATEGVVLSHRKSEKDEMNKILLTYLAFCHRTQVQASLLVAENEHIHDGIVNLVKDNGITKLVMGSIPDNCFKLKANHSKAYFMAKNAPEFCEIWFVWRGRHIWTREASTSIDNAISVYNQDDVMTRKRTRCSPNSYAGSVHDEGYTMYRTSTLAEIHEGTVSDLQAAGSAFNSTFWPDFSVNIGTLQLHSEEILDKNLKQVMMETEASRKEAFVELLKRKRTESEVAIALARAKASESSQIRELKTRAEVEGLFAATRKQHEDLQRNKEKATSLLNSSMRRLAIIDARARNIGLQVDEAAAGLEVIQSSIETLKQENPKTEKLEGRHTDQFEGCTHSHATSPSRSSISLDDDSYNFRELMPEAVRDLEQMHLKRARRVPSFFLCPILKETMDDPQVGADGLTYEGRAIREWLESGQETSRVTNLKLKHLNLTPNHALRFAIQDWLSQC